MSLPGHFLGCGLQSVKKKKKSPVLPPRAAGNAQILAPLVRTGFRATIRQLVDL